MSESAGLAGYMDNVDLLCSLYAMAWRGISYKIPIDVAVELKHRLKSVIYSIMPIVDADFAVLYKSFDIFSIRFLVGIYSLVFFQTHLAAAGMSHIYTTKTGIRRMIRRRVIITFDGNDDARFKV